MARQYLQGKYSIINRSKYIGTKMPFYRSSWELKAFKFFDLHSSILKWNSEGVVVPYVSPKDGKVHRYFVDLFAEIKEKDGNISRKLIEIKPASQCKTPRKSKNEKKFINECITFEVNKAKWKAAKQFAEKRGCSFIILNEYDLGIKKRKGLINRNATR